MISLVPRGVGGVRYIYIAPLIKTRMPPKSLLQLWYIGINRSRLEPNNVPSFAIDGLRFTCSHIVKHQRNENVNFGPERGTAYCSSVSATRIVETKRSK